MSRHTDVSLLLGLARSSIEPPLHSYLIGYGDRGVGCTAVRDHLLATAAVIGDGRSRVALVALDLLALNEGTVREIARAVHRRTGIAEDAVLLACSHTHCGPMTFAIPENRRHERRWVRELRRRIADTVARAAGAPPERVSLHHGLGSTDIGFQRRVKNAEGRVDFGVAPEGPHDHDLHVLQLRGSDGRARATVVCATCHPTVLDPALNAASAEWPGTMRARVEAATRAPCLFLQGGCGDMGPDHEWDEHDDEVLEETGRRVAREVLSVCRSGLEPDTTSTVGAARGRAALPLVLDPPGPDGRRLTYQERLAALTGVPWPLVDPLLDTRYPWHNSLRLREDGGFEVPLELSALRLGDVAVVAHGAETFCEVGMAVKTASPAPHTVFAGYSNGMIGYLPTERAHHDGGYEVDMVPYLYRLPGRFAPQSAEIAVDASVKLAKSLF